MTREEAEKYAKNMTYREAICNLKQAKSVPYRKATFIKINELLNELEQESRKGHWIEHEWEEMREKGYYRCSVCNHSYQRYTKGIRKSDVPYIDGQEYKLWNCDNYCPNCGADMREVYNGNVNN